VRIRRVVLDVDKAVSRPDLVDLAAAIEAAEGVEAANLTVTEIDIETVGMDVTVVGDGIDLGALVSAIEHTGSVVHSVDELVVGEHLVERVKRER
jgi:hypothetical protein